MPAVQVLKVTDSLTGAELDPETKPLTISVGRRSWSLYLSDTNRSKVMAQIEKWTESEPETTTTASHATTRSRTRAPEPKTDKAELLKIRAWAEANGEKISTRGRIPQPVRERYEAAQNGQLV